jgi:twin arginine-targeting protein translocase, TatA/E family
MFGLGWQEILLILLLVLFLFGAKRLPGIAKSMGKSVQEFKKGIDPNAKDEEKSDEEKMEEKKNEILK